MATHSSILAWRIPWTEGAWQATVYRVAKRHDYVIEHAYMRTHTHTHTHINGNRQIATQKRLHKNTTINFKNYMNVSSTIPQ